MIYAISQGNTTGIMKDLENEAAMQGINFSYPDEAFYVSEEYKELFKDEARNMDRELRRFGSKGSPEDDNDGYESICPVESIGPWKISMKHNKSRDKSHLIAYADSEVQDLLVRHAIGYLDSGETDEQKNKNIGKYLVFFKKLARYKDASPEEGKKVIEINMLMEPTQKSLRSVNVSMLRFMERSMQNVACMLLPEETAFSEAI